MDRADAEPAFDERAADRVPVVDVRKADEFMAGFVGLGEDEHAAGDSFRRYLSTACDGSGLLRYRFPRVLCLPHCSESRA